MGTRKGPDDTHTGGHLVIRTGKQECESPTPPTPMTWLDCAQHCLRRVTKSPPVHMPTEEVGEFTDITCESPLGQSEPMDLRDPEF